jgi:hypothetical protein
MPSKTHCLRTQAEEYRLLAAAVNNNPVRLQLHSIANHFDHLAERNEGQRQRPTEEGTASR